MKKIGIIFIALSLVLVSCKAKKEAKVAEEKAKTEVEKVAKETLTDEEVPKGLLLGEDYKGMVVISLVKTACFGTCPDYSLTIYDNGWAVYEGRQHVKMKGKFIAKFPKEQIRAEMQSAAKMKYFSLKGKYDNENVTDLPSIITYINYDGKDKKVFCRFECDPIVKKVTASLEYMIQSVEWSEMR